MATAAPGGSAERTVNEMAPVEITRPTEKTVRLRFKENVCYGGVNFGPHYEQREAEVREDWAKYFIRQGKAEEVTGPAADELGPIPETDPDPGPEDPNRIPEDFPGAKALADAGVTTFDALDEIEDLTAVKGIGPKLAEQIEAALDELAVEE